jgi:hypothetical protein
MRYGACKIAFFLFCLTLGMSTALPYAQAATSIGLDIQTDGVLAVDGDVHLDDASADTITIGQNGGTADTVVIAGNVAITDTQWSISDAGAIAGASLDITGAGEFGSLTVLGAIDPGFTLGSIVFDGVAGLAQDNANFFWDDSNNRLGLLTAAPLSTLDNSGSLATDGTTAVGATGLNWRVGTATSYAAGIENTNNGTTSHGLFLKVANSSAFPLRTAGGLAYLSSGFTTRNDGVSEAFGHGASAASDRGTAVGAASAATGIRSVAVGFNATTPIGTNSAIAIGPSAAATASNQLVISALTASGGIRNAYLGNGVTDAGPLSITLNATGGSGTNIAGADMVIAGGKGTGNAAGGRVILQTSTAGASSATLQTLATNWQIQNAGNAVGHGTTPNSLITYGLAMLSPNVVGLRVTGPGGGATHFAAMDSDNTVASATGRTSGNLLLFGYNHRADSGTPSDNYDTYLFKRGSQSNGGSITAAGSVMTISNTNTIGAGSVTDSVAVLKLSQSANSTGDILQAQSNTTPVFAIKSGGHLHTAGTAPAVSSCGTGPSVVGTDTAGRITVGTGSPSSCTLTFASAYANIPSCTVNHEGAILLVRGVPSTTTLVIDTATAFTDGGIIDYICVGRE